MADVERSLRALEVDWPATPDVAARLELAPRPRRRRRVEIAPGLEGIWLAGGEHVAIFPAVRPRLAGHVLVWATGAVTFRLEGPALTRERALELARTISGTAPG